MQCIYCKKTIKNMKTHQKSVSCISAKKEIEILNLKKIIKKEFNVAKNKLNFMHYYISTISDNEFNDFKLKFKIGGDSLGSAVGEGSKDDFINLVISEFDIIKKKIDEPIDYTKEIERSSMGSAVGDLVEAASVGGDSEVEGVIDVAGGDLGEAVEGVIEGVVEGVVEEAVEGVVAVEKGEKSKGDLLMKILEIYKNKIEKEGIDVSKINVLERDRLQRDVLNEWTEDIVNDIGKSSKFIEDIEEEEKKENERREKYRIDKENMLKRIAEEENIKKEKMKERYRKEKDARSNAREIWFRDLPEVSDKNLEVYRNLKESNKRIKFECNTNYKWIKGDPITMYQIDNLYNQGKITSEKYKEMCEEHNDICSAKRDKIERGYDMFIEYQEFLNNATVRKGFYEHLTNNANEKWKPPFMEYIEDYFKEAREAGYNVHQYDWEIVGFLLEQKDYKHIDYNKVNLRKILGWDNFK